MSSFSNRLYIQSLTPSASSGSGRTGILAGVSIAGIAILSIGMWIHYRRQLEILKTQNEILLAKLEAASLQLPNSETEMDMDENNPEQAN